MPSKAAASSLSSNRSKSPVAGKWRKVVVESLSAKGCFLVLSTTAPKFGNGWIWNNRSLESKGSPRLRWRELMLDWNGQGWEAHPAESYRTFEYL